MLASVVGKVRPLTESPAPLTVACEMVTEEAPVLVNVSDWLLLVPTVIEPNERFDGFEVSCPAVVPVPERGKLTLPCAPVVAKATLPVKLPLPVGAKVTVVEVLVPACRVRGSARLLIVNPAPLKVAWLIVRSAVPVFEIVTLLFWFDPTVTLPKLSCAGFRVRTPPFAAVPVAVTAARTSEFAPRKESVCERLPLALGLYCTVNAALWPAASTCGCVRPITCKLALDPVMPLIVTDEVELFVSVSCRDLLLPTATVPKFKLALPSTTPPPPEFPDKL